MATNEIAVAGQAADIKIRPYEHHAKYYETDQMGIIHHSNYVKSGSFNFCRLQKYGTF